MERESAGQRRRREGSAKVMRKIALQVTDVRIIKAKALMSSQTRKVSVVVVVAVNMNGTKMAAILKSK